MDEKRQLGTGDRIAIIALLGGLGGTLAAVALEHAYPELGVWGWRLIFWPSITVMFCAVGFLFYDLSFRTRLRGKRLDPLIATATVAALVTFVYLGIYALKGSPAGTGDHGSTKQPEITLLPRKDRYTFKWDPTTRMDFNIQRDGFPLPPAAGNTANPGFILHNSGTVPAADVIVTWHAEISGIKDLAKIGRLAKYDIRFPDDYTLDLIAPSSAPIGNFRYNPNPDHEMKLPFVARDTDLFLPLGIYPILGLFIAAKMPDELGAKTEPFPLRIDVSWNVPDGGEPKSFNVKIRGVNTKPSGLTGPPEVAGYLEFEIEKSK